MIHRRLLLDLREEVRLGLVLRRQGQGLCLDGVLDVVVVVHRVSHIGVGEEGIEVDLRSQI